MRIELGLMNGQVLQRNRRNLGSANVEGTCLSEGPVETRVLLHGRTLPGHGWKASGLAASGKFSARIKALPMGGPYRIEFRIADGRRTMETTRVRDVFVGDVWILAGQSNMEGIGNLEHAPRPDPGVRAFYMRDAWGMAREKLHFLPEAVDVVHNGYGDGPERPGRADLEKIRRSLIKGVSPGLAFGLVMHRRTGIPQGLVACAHGGTSMAQWSPQLRDKGGASLYGALIRRCRKLGQPVAGVLWYQGESDANSEATVSHYSANMKKLVAATRRDLKLPRLPWVVVQIGCHACPENGSYWNRIQDQQRRLPESIPHLDVVPTLDLELDDGIHISGRGQQVLGGRLARAASRLAHHDRTSQPGITFKRVRIVPTPSCGPGGCSVELTYGNVAGSLQSAGRPVGFSLINEHGHDAHPIYKTTLHANRVLLHTALPRDEIEKLSVVYGHGRYPVCNITDGENMSLPGLRIALNRPRQVPG